MNNPITSAEAQILAADIKHIRQDMARQTNSIESISRSLQVLTRLEEGHSQIMEKITVVGAETRAHETRLQAIERDMPGLREVRRWVIGGVLAGIGMMGMSLVKLTLIDPVAIQKVLVQVPQQK